jgi:serine/threonine protein kinase
LLLLFLQKEAIVMEKLTYSPRIVDLYGYCATSIIAEAMPVDVTTLIVPGDKLGYDRGRMHQKDLDQLQLGDVHPLNNFTVPEKLQLALTMAESLADLHGFPGGVMSHGDYHPDQHLQSAQGELKLNDFNNARFLDFSEEKNAYCRYSISYGGTYKSPEEFGNDWCDEGVDTFSFGHNIYGLLTGLYPMYDTFSHTQVRKRILNHELPYVDPRYRTRSYIEGRLVEIMEKCWAYQSSDRVSVFEIVKFLRETKRVYERQNKNQGGLRGILQFG